MDIVNQASSPFGAGWSLDNVESLVAVTGGVILVQPGGTSLWFAGSGGSFTSPAGDFSTLVQNQKGVTVGPLGCQLEESLPSDELTVRV